MKQILNLEDTDDITSIKNRIDFALPVPVLNTSTTGKPEQQRLLLIVPRKNQALRSLVNMKLLARMAKSRAVKLAIVSNQPKVRDYAKVAGVKAYGSVRRAKWAGWGSSQTPVIHPDETLPPVTAKPEVAPVSVSSTPPVKDVPPPLPEETTRPKMAPPAPSPVVAPVELPPSPTDSPVAPPDPPAPPIELPPTPTELPVSPPEPATLPVASPDKQETKPEQKRDPSSPRKQKQPKIKRVEKKKYTFVIGSGRVGILQQLGALILLFALALPLVLGVIILLPEANVTITPVAKTVKAELIVEADPNVEAVNFSTLTFPARIDQVELEMTDHIETTDTELAPVGRGVGTITIINRTEVEQIIPISSTVSTSAGEQIDFMIAQTVTIPAGIGALTITQVLAVKPGPQGNVSAGKINRFIDPTYALLARVVNETALDGGTMAPAKIVENEDKERLQAHLRQKIQQEGLEQLQQGLEGQEFISPETLQVIMLDITYNEFSGDFSETFSGEMQAVVRGTVVGGYNANRLALAALEAQVPAGFELDVEGLHFGAGEVLNVEEGIVTFKIFSTGKYTPVIDPHHVAQTVAWLPIGEAQARLEEQYTLATIPGIEVKPDWAVEWLGRLPYYTLRINVIIKDAVDLVNSEE